MYPGYSIQVVPLANAQLSATSVSDVCRRTFQKSKRLKSSLSTGKAATVLVTERGVTIYDVVRCTYLTYLRACWSKASDEPNKSLILVFKITIHHLLQHFHLGDHPRFSSLFETSGCLSKQQHQSLRFRASESKLERVQSRLKLSTNQQVIHHAYIHALSLTFLSFSFQRPTLQISRNSSWRRFRLFRY